MSTGPLAVIADVPGNRWALDAVVADARRSGARRFVDLGDCVSGPLDPRGAAERLMELAAPTIRGNHDRAVTSADEPGPSDAFAREQLTDAQLDWLAALPAGAELDGLLLCHGAPGDDERYLLEEVVPGATRRRDPAAVRTLLDAAGIGAGAPSPSLVLCAHTHLQRLLPLGDGRAVVNPGSVGLPAYDGDTPHPHVIESGSPHARYALLHPRGARWEVELRAVAYAWDQAAAAARARGREDWAVALETGLASKTVRGA
jgi:diadenosine tetraphosphatase ApaH/serine/threonine PP2A family protein phosphatase